MYSQFQVLDSGFFDSGFRSPIIRGIPHSLICILNSKTKGSGFHKKNFSDSTGKISWIPQEKLSGFRNSDSLTRGEPKVCMATNDNTGL